jgi:hypothetical protein
MSKVLADLQVDDDQRDGYVIARGTFDTDESDLLHSAAVADRESDRRSSGRADGEGASSASRSGEPRDSSDA